MPCFVTGSAEGDAKLSASESHAKATKLTDLLCSVCDQLERTNNLAHLPAKVHVWWNEHKKIDAERLKREKEELEKVRLKANALSKLTDAERRVLGL